MPPKKKTPVTPAKCFVLDTSVLLHSPQSLFAFADNTVVIPLAVLEEIDTFKKGTTNLNHAARQVIRTLDDLRGHGSLTEGVRLPSGGCVLVLTDDDTELPKGLGKSADNRIIAAGLFAKSLRTDSEVTVVSKDINLRVKAEAVGLKADDYLHGQVISDELYTGTRTIDMCAEEISDLHEQGSIETLEGEAWLPHEFALLRGGGSALVRYDQKTKTLKKIPDLKRPVFGLGALNREQRFAFEALLDDSIPLVTLVGKAGTGKTLLALACGLQKILHEKTHKKLAVYRPVVPMGRDLGYLPGDEQEKLGPWMQPIYDNMELLLTEKNQDKFQGQSKRSGSGCSGIDHLQDMGLLDIKALTYIRGRSLPYQFIIVDEAQNLTPHEAKTIITRAGVGTKIVLTGDPDQIDHPYLDKASNGLTYVVEKFKSEQLAAHVTLTRGERSPLANRASEIMEGIGL